MFTTEADNKKLVNSNHSDDEEKQINEYVKVMVGGFPLGSKISEIRKFLCKRFPVRRINITTDKKNKFYGFVFIKFDKREEAESFTKEDLFFENDKLDVKFAVNNFQFIEECIQNTRHPNKVFIDNIPKNYSKQDVFDIFSRYGKVTDVVCVTKKEKVTNLAHVTFEDTETAKTCVNSDVRGTEDTTYLRVEYGNPKFSSKMLSKIHPLLQNYITEIQEHIKAFNPKDFDNLCNDLINSGQAFIIATLENHEQAKKKVQKKINGLNRPCAPNQTMSHYDNSYPMNESVNNNLNGYGANSLLNDLSTDIKKNSFFGNNIQHLDKNVTNDDQITCQTGMSQECLITRQNQCQYSETDNSSLYYPQYANDQTSYYLDDQNSTYDGNQNPTYQGNQNSNYHGNQYSGQNSQHYYNIAYTGYNQGNLTDQNLYNAGYLNQYNGSQQQGYPNTTNEIQQNSLQNGNTVDQQNDFRYNNNVDQPNNYQNCNNQFLYNDCSNEKLQGSHAQNPYWNNNAYTHYQADSSQENFNNYQSQNLYVQQTQASFNNTCNDNSLYYYTPK